MKRIILMKEIQRNRMSFIFKLVFVILLVFGLIQIIIKYNEKEHKKYRYIGNSILETPNLMPENCSVKQMEYYENLVSNE